MKNLSIVLNIILLVAILPLYYFQFSGNTTTTSTSETEGKAATGKIAYFDADTLLSNYLFAKDLRKDFQRKRETVESQLSTRAGKLEGELVNFQRRAQAGLMSRNEISTTEQSLLKKQQDLQNYQQTVAQGLMAEEQELNKQLYDKIKEYLATYNKGKEYEVIMQYTQGGVLWLADDALDITNDVLKGLNDQYDAEEANAEEGSEN